MAHAAELQHRLLIVEHNDSISGAVEQALQRLHLIADRVTDGWDAIAKLEERDYAVIVVDVNLPRRTGFGVFTYLREERGHDLGNLIMMTDADEEEVSRKLGEDRVHVIRKDRVQELESVIAECARKRN